MEAPEGFTTIFFTIASLPRILPPHSSLPLRILFSSSPLSPFFTHPFLFHLMLPLFYTSLYLHHSPLFLHVPFYFTHLFISIPLFPSSTHPPTSLFPSFTHPFLFLPTLPFFYASLFGQRLRREPKETKSCRIGGICTSVRTSVRPSVRPPPETPQAQASQSRSSQLRASL